MKRQRGVSTGMVLILLALIAVGFVATAMLSRLQGSTDDRVVTERRLQRAADAIEAFAASATRLPCPAKADDTTATEGEEQRTAGASTCLEPAGVVPWKTIGLRKEDSLDAWGRRLSYRVYTGAGSLTQDGGVSMIYCDSWEVGANQSADANGLCVNGGTPESRSTSETAFYAGKGLDVDDMGRTPANVAFLLISHGASGLGAYSTTGVRVEPAPGGGGAEGRNLSAGGQFRIQPFSGPNVFPRDNDHFDDILAYRTLPDLVKRINLAARDWKPEPVPPGSTQFTGANVTAAAAAMGRTVTGTNTNTPVLVFDSVTAIGVSGNSFENLSLATVNGNAGIGVTGTSNPRMTYSEGEWMIFLFDSASRQFGVTFNDFGTYTQAATEYTEQVLLLFYSNETFVKGYVAKGCRPDGGLASFTVNVGVNFNRAYILPYAASTSTTAVGDTGLFISEIRSCSATAPNCRTALSSAENSCPEPAPI